VSLPIIPYLRFGGFGFNGFGSGFDGRNIRVEFGGFPRGGSGGGNEYEGAGNGFTFNFGGFDWSNLFGGGSRAQYSNQQTNQRMRSNSKGNKYLSTLLFVDTFCSQTHTHTQ
jgi:hypothetical protein